MNDDSQRAIVGLKSRYPMLHVREGLDLECMPDECPGDRFAFYRLVGDGRIYFRVRRVSQQLEVHLWWGHESDCRLGTQISSRVKKIVRRHNDIVFETWDTACHRQKIECRRDFESVIDSVKDALGDLYDLLEPSWQTADEAQGQFEVPDVAVSRECMASFRRKSCYLEWNGVPLKPLESRRGGTDALYFGERFDGNVYYELCRKQGTLVLELHDDRVLEEPDALVANLQKLARENDFVFDGLCGTGSVVSSNPVSCARPLASIKQDVESVFREMKAVFDPILDKAEKEGIESLTFYTLDVEKMADLSVPETAEGAIRLNALKKETFAWVPTVGELFEKKVIELDDDAHTRIVSGQYVIPDYQRKYAWTAENVRTLCRDLLRAARDGKGKGYHLGTIILHVDKSKEEFYVVDGQQRLRTISRLLSRKFFFEGSSAKPYFSQFTAQDQRTILEILHEYSEDERRLMLEMLWNSTLVCIAVTRITESFQLFSTQNGRGKELSPENLLKAYHFHELEQTEGTPIRPEEVENLDGLDDRWEEANIAETKHDGRLLSEVIGEHLYRIRCWTRGVFVRESFSSRELEAFKGVTIDPSGGGNVPLQNLSLLRKLVESNKALVKNLPVQSRSLDDGMDSFVTIDQPIVNGRDFFNYADTYVNAYRRLFEQTGGAGLEVFGDFYSSYCCGYTGWDRRGDQYARHIFQSLCLVCYDRFGARGLLDCHKDLYRCAYFERVTKSRCYYSTCGQRFAVEAVQVLYACYDLSRLAERLHELGRLARVEYVRANAQNLPAGLDHVQRVYKS